MQPSRQSTVLVVDDDPAIRSFLTAALHDAGYQVVTAANGAQALEWVISAAPNLVLTDLQMPVLNGVELLVSMRAQGVESPVLLMSAGTNAGAEAIAYGFDGFLTKPFSLESLLAAVARCISGGERSTPMVHRSPNGSAVRRKVLIVNANDDLSQLLRLIAEESGFEAQAIHPDEMGAEPEEVCDALRRYEPKVVIYDISLPYPATWSLFQRIRARQRRDGDTWQFVVTTANKRALEQHAGPTSAIELVGDRRNRDLLAQAVVRAAGVPDVCC